LKSGWQKLEIVNMSEVGINASLLVTVFALQRYLMNKYYLDLYVALSNGAMGYQALVNGLIFRVFKVKPID